MSGKKQKIIRKLAELHSVAQTEPWTPFVESIVAQMADRDDVRFFTNSRYQVNVTRFMIDPPFGKCFHLSIKTLDKAPYHDWRDYQRIKNELVGPEYEAVELYPAESRLVDTSNQYHLWCFLEFKFPFGYKKRDVSDAQEFMGLKYRQRKFENPPPDNKPCDPNDVLNSTYEEMYFGKKIG